MKQLIRRARDIFANEGGAVLCQRIGLRIKRKLGLRDYDDFDQGYARWIKTFDQPLTQSEVDSRLQRLSGSPTISILVPVYNVELIWLKQAVDSVKSQRYPHWQLCIVDDASSDQALTHWIKSLAGRDNRIVVRLCETNKGIGNASNQALALANGQYIGLLDHDDLLAKDALLFVAEALEESPNVKVVYSDEDKVSTKGERHSPYFKPDFSPTLLQSQNYIGHFVVAERQLVKSVGGFRCEFDGAQDYDLLLRLASATKAFFHIPKVLYHWRSIPGSTASGFSEKSYAVDAGRKALQSYFDSNHQRVIVENAISPGTYRCRADITGEPKISIILPFKDQAELLDKCLCSVLDKTQWQNLEIIAINNNSEQPQTTKLITSWQQKTNTIRFVDYNDAFNYSKISNFGVNQANGEYLVLLNSDIEITSSNWLETLLGFAQQNNVGAVGCRLWYPDGKIQHAGIVIGIDNGAGHPYKGFPKSSRGYFQRLQIDHNVSAVTGALMMVSREKFLAVGGLDEIDFAVAYNDVDFCLKLLKSGYNNVLASQCTAIHFESSTRGTDQSKTNKERHDREKALLRQKWRGLFDSGDPFYNSNLTLAREDYSLNQFASQTFVD